MTNDMKILDAIEPKVLDRMVSRRAALKRGAAGGASLAAMLAMPAAVCRGCPSQ